MSYGTNAPIGVRPLTAISGGGWTQKTRPYNIPALPTGLTTYATSLFRGDPVVWNPTLAIGGSNVAGGTISRYAYDNAVMVNNVGAVIGSFCGCEYYDVNGNFIFSPAWIAGTLIKANTSIVSYIMDDPMGAFEMQVSTATDVLDDARFTYNAQSTLYPATGAMFGQNFAFGLGGGGATVVNPTAGSVLYGGSAMYLNLVGTTSTVRTTVTLPFKVFGLVDNIRQNTIRNSTGAYILPYLNVIGTYNTHAYKAGTPGITAA